MKLYYWRGKSVIGWLVRTITRSAWDHVAIGCTVDGLECYLESLPLTGVRLVPVSFDPPDAYQEVGRTWEPGELRRAMQHLGTGYGFVDAILAGFGFPPRHHGEECAELVADILGLAVIPTPELVVESIERATGNPVLEMPK